MEKLLETMYDITHKTNIIMETNPEMSNLVQDLLTLFVGVIDKYEEKFNKLNEELDDHKEKLWDLHNRTMFVETSFNLNPYDENGKHKCVGDCKTGNCSTDKKQINFTQENIDLANSLFDIKKTDDYKTFINNKKNEAKNFVESVNEIKNKESLSNNLDTLSNFIESKI